MNVIALTVATGCVGWRDSAGAGGKEPVSHFTVFVGDYLTLMNLNQYHFL